jgi:hypothetical protein
MDKIKTFVLLFAFIHQFKYFDYYSSIPLWYSNFSSTFENMLVFNELLFATLIVFYFLIKKCTIKLKINLFVKLTLVIIASLACLPHIYIWGLYFYYASIANYLILSIIYTISYLEIIVFLKQI